MTHDEFQAAFRKELSTELTALPMPHAPQQLVLQILRRDQRRTRWLAIWSLLFWLLGALGLAIMVFDLNELVILMRVASVPPSPDAPNSPAHALIAETSTIHHSLPWVGGGSVLALMVAALLTVLLIFSSRQATLSRINISLLEISDQLRARGPATS